MTIAAVNSITPAGPVTTLPMTLVQTTCRSRKVFKLLFVTSAAAVLLAPFGLLAAIAATDPVAFITTAQQPAVAIQLSLALMVGIAFVALPLRHVLQRSVRERSITISNSTVSVVEIGRNSRTEWHEPLSTYSGIAHNIRTSLSGARHEVILVHPLRDRSVMVQMADRIAQSNIDVWSDLTSLPEIHARAIYQSATRKPVVTLSSPHLQAA